MRPLNLLLIEDSEDDAALLLYFLEQGGFEPHYQRVETLAQFEAALNSQSWDLILADYNLPRFSGLAALKRLQEMALDIPFILVSGAIGEETAVTAMKAGAHDYLLKDNLARLAPAVDRELKEAESRQCRRKAEEERTRLLQELEEAKALAELANQRKSKVLAFVAHEFKNPLKAVNTFTELLLNSSTEALTENQRTHVSHIAMACDHLRELINDILDIAPIEAGVIQLNIQQVRLDNLLEDVRAIVEHPAEKKHVLLSFNAEPGIDFLQVDSKRFRQILINLLSNAVKYTHNNDTVILNLLRDKEGQALIVQVIDHGPGIPETEIKNLFQDYYRVRNKLTTQKEGLGLGLALTQKLVELHGGTIQVESEPDTGTCFEIRLPASCVAPTRLVGATH